MSTIILSSWYGNLNSLCFEIKIVNHFKFAFILDFGIIYSSDVFAAKKVVHVPIG